jgi:hypothetical protein
LEHKAYWDQRDEPWSRCRGGKVNN